MIAGSQLAEQGVDPKAAMSSVSSVLELAGSEVGFWFRLIAKLRAAIETRVPVGYQDETGFHYGTSRDEWFFSI